MVEWRPFAITTRQMGVSRGVQKLVGARRWLPPAVPTAALPISRARISCWLACPPRTQLCYQLSCRGVAARSMPDLSQLSDISELAQAGGMLSDARSSTAARDDDEPGNCARPRHTLTRTHAHTPRLTPDPALPARRLLGHRAGAGAEEPGGEAPAGEAAGRSRRGGRRGRPRATRAAPEGAGAAAVAAGP